MLVTLDSLLQKAKLDNRAIPAFNVYNLETVQAAFEAAKNMNYPVIIAFGEGYMSYVSIEVIGAIVKELAKDFDIPVVLHLDHAKEVESIERAIKCGFTSVMYDGSAYPLEVNIKNTKKVVELAHAEGVSVEGELGYMNNEDGTTEEGLDLKKGYTDPNDAANFVKNSGVDALAIAIGNAHGIYKGIPELNFTALENIVKDTGIPIVLHGCSGIPDEMIKKAVSLGVCKINVNTELSISGVAALREFLDSNKQKDIRFEKVLGHARSQITAAAERYIKLLK